MKHYQAIAQYHAAIENCKRTGNTKWQDHWTAKLDAILASGPHGSGFDAGMALEYVSNVKIVFRTSFHHMNEAGYYVGWTEHLVTVRADLSRGYSLTISGKNRNGIKEYIAECFGSWLDTETA